MPLWNFIFFRLSLETFQIPNYHYSSRNLLMQWSSIILYYKYSNALHSPGVGNWLFWLGVIKTTYQGLLFPLFKPKQEIERSEVQPKGLLPRSCRWAHWGLFSVPAIFVFHSSFAFNLPDFKIPPGKRLSWRAVVATSFIIKHVFHFYHCCLRIWIMST